MFFQTLTYLLLLILYGRVSIWPPPQRAPAPAVVHPDRPTHHEPEEWGRGGTSSLCSLGFRWATWSAIENHDLGSVSPCQAIPQVSRGEESNTALNQLSGGNITLSPLSETIHLSDWVCWIVYYFYLSKAILILLVVIRASLGCIRGFPRLH